MKVKILCILTVFHSTFFTYKIKKNITNHCEYQNHINNLLLKKKKKEKETPPGHQEGETRMLIICFKAIRKKYLTVVHLQYSHPSDRWHPNYIKSCLFCLLCWYSTWLKIYRNVRDTTALSSRLWAAFTEQKQRNPADNNVNVHLPGFQT